MSLNMTRNPLFNREHTYVKNLPQGYYDKIDNNYLI